MQLKKLIFAGSVAFGVSALAQAKSPEAAKPAAAAAAAPSMPTLPSEGKKLVEGSLGNWKSSDVALVMGDTTMKGNMEVKCEKAAGGWGALCKSSIDMGKAMPKQELVFLYGWDIGAGEGRMYEVTNLGVTHAHMGKWADDKSITLVHSGKNFEGKDEKDSVTFTWNSPNEMSVKGIAVQGSATIRTFTATMKK